MILLYLLLAAYIIAINFYAFLLVKSLRDKEKQIESTKQAEPLSISKTALNTSYTFGDRITYVISLVNSGAVPLNDLTVTDDLGGYTFGTGTVYPLTYVDGSLLYLINGVPQPTPTVVSADPLTVSGLQVPAGGNATIVYEAEINSYAPLDTQGAVTNTVSATGASLPEAVTATETVNALNAPDLSISKALFPETVTENGSLTYTFVISNYGNTPAVATDNLVVTDTFDPIITINSVTLDGVPLSLGTGYTYDPSTGLFETVQSVITVPAATYVQNSDGSYTTVPGTATLTVNGTI